MTDHQAPGAHDHMQVHAQADDARGFPHEHGHDDGRSHDHGHGHGSSMGISGVMLHVAGDAINSEIYFPRHAMSRLSYSRLIC